MTAPKPTAPNRNLTRGLTPGLPTNTGSFKAAEKAPSGTTLVAAQTFESVAKAQGWTEATENQVVRDFIDTRDNAVALRGYLLTVAVDENRRPRMTRFADPDSGATRSATLDVFGAIRVHEFDTTGADREVGYVAAKAGYLIDATIDPRAHAALLARFDESSIEDIVDAQGWDDFTVGAVMRAYVYDTGRRGDLDAYAAERAAEENSMADDMDEFDDMGDMDEMHDIADSYISQLSEEEKVAFLLRQGVPAEAIDHADLDEQARDGAHLLASSAFNNGETPHTFETRLFGNE